MGRRGVSKYVTCKAYGMDFGRRARACRAGGQYVPGSEVPTCFAAAAGVGVLTALMAQGGPGDQLPARMLAVLRDIPPSSPPDPHR